MENEIAGLHLWSVTVTSIGERNWITTWKLWITTPTKQIRTATQKASAFIKGDAKYPKAAIEAVEYEGTIDA